MQLPFVVVQRCEPVWPRRQSSRPASRQAPQLVVVQETPETLALQACISIVVEVPVHPAVVLPLALHVGVLHVRVWRPVRSHVPGMVCVHAPQGLHVVAPQIAPVTSALRHIWLSGTTLFTHAPLAHVGVVVVRVCVPIVAHVAPTMQGDHALMTTSPHDMPLVVRMHACDSGVSVATQAPPAQCDVVAMRVCVPACVHGSVPKSHADQSPNVPAAHMSPSVVGRVQACISVEVLG